MTTSPHYTSQRITVWHGDCLDVLRDMEPDSVDAVVTDPPYGLEFMGAHWDAPWTEAGINRDAGFSGGSFSAVANAPQHTSSTNPACLTCGGKKRGRRDGTALRSVCLCDQPQFPNVRAVEMRAFQDWCQLWAAECLRVLKPGGWLLAFGGTRTAHRLACAIEDAGFEIRDSIAWLYGSGFPKNLNVARSIDTELCVLPGRHRWSESACKQPGDHVCPVTPEGLAHAGEGTALKPSHEPIVVARKPLAGTVAGNVLTHGTGALNIDGCRVEGGARPVMVRTATEVAASSMAGKSTGATSNGEMTTTGRWPPNVVLDDTAAAELDRQSGETTSPPVGSVARTQGGQTIGTFDYAGRPPSPNGHGDSGGASRFFPVFRYEAKAPTSERPRNGGSAHATVKPLDLMRWLVRLVTPPGGLVLDPFAGSGTTGGAALAEGFRSVLIEREADYLPLIMQRIHRRVDPVAYVAATRRQDDGQPDLFGEL